MILKFLKKFLFGSDENKVIKGNGNQVIHADNNSQVNARNNSPDYTNKGIIGRDFKGNNIAFGQNSKAQGDINYEENVETNSLEDELFSKIDELLSYIRSDQGKKELNPEDIEAIEEQSDIIKQKVKSKSITAARLRKFNDFLRPYMNIITSSSLITGVISASTDLITFLGNQN